MYVRSLVLVELWGEGELRRMIHIHTISKPCQQAPQLLPVILQQIQQSKEVGSADCPLSLNDLTPFCYTGQLIPFYMDDSPCTDSVHGRSMQGGYDTLPAAT